MTSSSPVRGCHLLTTPSYPATGQPEPLTCSCSGPGPRVLEENPLRGSLRAGARGFHSCLPPLWLGGGQRCLGLSSSSELHPHSTQQLCVPPVHCLPRSRYRLGAQAEPRYVTLASHSTSVNLSFFIFKMKKIRESIWGPLWYITDTCPEKGGSGEKSWGDDTRWILVTFMSVIAHSNGIIHLASSFRER